MCLSNRSACLFHTGDLDAALVDCLESVALQPDYDKAWSRLAEIHLKRGSHSQCIDAASKVRAPTPTLTECIKLARAHIDRHGPSGERQIQTLMQLPPTATIQQAEANSRIAHAHQAVQLQHSFHAGRFLTAGQPIAAGTTLISEAAYAAVLRNVFRPQPTPTRDAAPNLKLDNLRCEWCFNRLALSKPAAPAASQPWFVTCRSCRVAYCSTTCRDRHQAEHQFECGMHQFLDRLPEVTRLAIRLCVRGWRAPGRSPESANVWAANAADVASLEPHIDAMPAGALIEYQFQAALCVSFFMKQHELKHACKLSDDGTNTCWHTAITHACMLHHLCQTRTNIYAITHVQSSSPIDSDCLIASPSQIRLAVGLFPTGALVNHACTPNISLKYYGRHLVVRSVDHITNGSEISNCYGPMHGHMAQAERRETLQQEYFFTCKCKQCTESDKQNK